MDAFHICLPNATWMNDYCFSIDLCKLSYFVSYTRIRNCMIYHLVFEHHLVLDSYCAHSLKQPSRYGKRVTLFCSIILTASQSFFSLLLCIEKIISWMVCVLLLGNLHIWPVLHPFFFNFAYLPGTHVPVSCKIYDVSNKPFFF